MKLLVFVTQVLHPDIPLEIREREGLVVQKEPQSVYTVNPSDRCALEEAMGLKARFGAEVSVVTVGPLNMGDCLYYCLARGADNAIHVLYDAEEGADVHASALILSKTATKCGFDLILCGNKTLDLGGSQAGPIVAELLGLPQVTQVVGVELDSGGSRVRVERKLEKGNREVVESPLPALLAMESSTNPPRYVSTYSYLSALKKNVQKLSLESLGLDAGAVKAGASMSKMVEVKRPRPRPKKMFVPDSELSAEERIALLLSGGPPTEAKSSGGLLEGTPEKIADEVLDYLKSQKLWP